MASLMLCQTLGLYGQGGDKDQQAGENKLFHSKDKDGLKGRPANLRYPAEHAPKERIPMPNRCKTCKVGMALCEKLIIFVKITGVGRYM